MPTTALERITRDQFTHDQIEIELNYIQNNLICDNTIQLKVGAQVMCVVNIELTSDTMLCNGSQGIITRISENKLPVVKWNNGYEMEMGPHFWQSEIIPGIGVSQIPLILAWALTIHKSQGATMDNAEIDVGTSVFECGQTYVALSRVKTLDGLFLTSFDVNKIKINRKVSEFYATLNSYQTAIQTAIQIKQTEQTKQTIIKEIPKIPEQKSHDTNYTNDKNDINDIKVITLL